MSAAALLAAPLSREQRLLHEEAGALAARVAKEPNPTRRIFYVCLGWGLLAPALLLMGDVTFPVVLAISIASGFFLSFGAWGLSATRGLSLLSLALNQAALGKLEVAELLAGMAEGASSVAIVRKQAALIGAYIALSRGDTAKCRILASVAIDTGSGPYARASGRLTALSALSFRAFASALAGEGDAAMRDVVEVRARAATIDLGAAVIAGERVLLEPPARVALAEAVVLSNAGKLAELRAHLAEHRSTILDGLTPRDRMLFHGLDRMSRARVDSPYRKTERAVRKDSTNEPPPEDWIERVFPDASPFVGRGRARVAPTSLEQPPLAPTNARRAANVPLAAANQRRRRLLPIALWVMFIAVLLAAVPIFLPTDVSTGTGVVWVAPQFAGILLLVFFTVFAFRMLKLRSARRAISAAYAAMAAGDKVGAEVMLEEIAQKAQPAYAARAALSLAQADNRSGRFTDALARAEAGMACIAQRQAMGVRTMLGQELVSERATAFAALGRTRDALREIDTLSSGYAGAARATFRTRLIAHLVDGELDEAATLAAGRPPQLPIDPRTELLADLVTATVGGGLGMADGQRLADDLARPEERAYVMAISPELVRRFDENAPATAESDSAAGARAHLASLDAAEHEAEQELAAESEAEEANAASPESQKRA